MLKRFTIECGDLEWSGKAKTIRTAFKKARFAILPRTPKLSPLARFKIENGEWFYQSSKGIMGTQVQLDRLLRAKVAPLKPKEQFSQR